MFDNKPVRTSWVTTRHPGLGRGRLRGECVGFVFGFHFPNEDWGTHFHL